MYKFHVMRTTHLIKVRVSFARPRQRSKEAFTSSRNSHNVCKHYYELVGIPIRYAATHYFRRCISVSLLRFRSREIIVCLIILICYSATLCAGYFYNQFMSGHL